MVTETRKLPWRTIPWWTLACVVAIVIFAGRYWQRTSLPSEVTIYGGPAGGRYDELAHAIAEEIESRFNIQVQVQSTKGSLENIGEVENGSADFAFYQPRTREVLRPETILHHPPAQFVANLYTEMVVPFVSSHNESGDGDAIVEKDVFSDLPGKTWACNDRLSGDYAVAQILLDHFDIDHSELEVQSVAYGDMEERIRDGSVDLGLVTSGMHAPVLQQLFESPDCRPVGIPHLGALVYKHTSMRPAVIPAGFYRTHPRPIPEQDFETVGTRAQLLTSQNTPVRLVEEITRIINDARFQRDHDLVELFAGGVEYATDRAEFEMHPGAADIYYPEFKPLLNPDFVEGTEGLRSFIVSMLVATWLVWRWWKRRAELNNEHRLDRYIHQLLDLELRQLDFDESLERDERTQLQGILDEVTLLRQGALNEFTAHELNEDRAVDCFMEMCHALSDKVNAKLTRQTLIQLLKPPG